MFNPSHCHFLNLSLEEDLVGHTGDCLLQNTHRWPAHTCSISLACHRWWTQILPKVSCARVFESPAARPGFTAFCALSASSWGMGMPRNRRAPSPDCRQGGWASSHHFPRRKQEQEQTHGPARCPDAVWMSNLSGHRNHSSKGWVASFWHCPWISSSPQPKNPWLQSFWGGGQTQGARCPKCQKTKSTLFSLWIASAMPFGVWEILSATID